MVIIGLILLVLGLVLGISLLFWLGVALLVVGLLLNFAGPTGPTGVRRRYY